MSRDFLGPVLTDHLQSGNCVVALFVILLDIRLRMFRSASCAMEAMKLQ